MQIDESEVERLQREGTLEELEAQFVFFLRCLNEKDRATGLANISLIITDRAGREYVMSPTGSQEVELNLPSKEWAKIKLSGKIAGESVANPLGAESLQVKAIRPNGKEFLSLAVPVGQPTTA